MNLSPSLQEYALQYSKAEPSADRKLILQPLLDYLMTSINQSQGIQLTFICTHNSRRSQFSQVWAQFAASYMGIHQVKSFSGGTEETAVNSTVVDTLKTQGFEVKIKEHESNARYEFSWDNGLEKTLCFSKEFDHPTNPQENFVAIMTCNSADEACPHVPGAALRIPIMYQDPKAYDGTDLQNEKYLTCSAQIATELLWVMRQATTQR